MLELTNPPIRKTKNSTVYIAKDNNGIQYAAKVTQYKSRAREEYNNRMQIQDSPYLVKTIGFFESNTNALIQMELSQEGDISNFQFVEASEWKLIFDISNALYQLHNNGWMHLDVSPGNILVFENTFKLADFGKLKQIGQFKEGDEGAGPYVSPEALAYYPTGPYQVGAPTDIFSFGVVLLEAVSGQLAPRGGYDGYEELRKGQLMLGSAGYPDNCTDELKRVVNAMLSPNPGSRPTAVDLVAISQRHI